MLPYQIAAALYTGEDPLAMGSGMPFLVPYQAFPTADGYLVVAAGNDRLWHRLCQALDRPDLADDPTLRTNPERVRQRDRLVAELELTFRSRGTAEWEAQLRSAGVPCSCLNTVGEAARHEQAAVLGMIQWPRSTELPSLGLPFRVDGVRPRRTALAPSLDAHGSSFRPEREIAS
jgi:crotonobetainyl-CoA:carnitine CoA-transferase CaiB-like acyl-CoA transferase